MDRRRKLHEILCGIINMRESDGDRHVYFQPPESVKMKYPAIRYSLSDISNTRADDSVFIQRLAYELVLIDEKPNSKYLGPISSLPYCRFDRSYVSDNFNHFVFTIYY